MSGSKTIVNPTDRFRVMISLNGETHTADDVVDVSWDDVRYTIVYANGAVKHLSAYIVDEVNIEPII